MSGLEDNNNQKKKIERALCSGNKGIKRWLKYPLKAVLIILGKISESSYKSLYPRYLKWLGIDISSSYSKLGDPWISPSCFFDPTAYGLITIGDGTTISFDVAILVHDYSIDKQMYINDGTHGLLLDSVSVGKNVFIGARSVILPGTAIGDNCIIGAGSIVKGKFSSDSIIAGNPARVIGNVKDHYAKHQAKKDIWFK